MLDGGNIGCPPLTPMSTMQQRPLFAPSSVPYLAHPFDIRRTATGLPVAVRLMEGLAPTLPRLQLELQTIFFTPRTQRLFYCLGLVFVPRLKHAFSFEEILEAAVCAALAEEGGHCGA